MDFHRSAHTPLLTRMLDFVSPCSFLVADLEKAEEDAAEGEEDYDGKGHHDTVGDVSVCADFRRGF